MKQPGGEKLDGPSGGRTNRRDVSGAGFFEFLRASGRYSETDIFRMNRRHSFLVSPFAQDIAGARVLDLGAHDGRWSYAFAAQGAREVCAIEARPEIISGFDDFPESSFKTRVDFRCEDMFDGLNRIARADERFDIVAVFGVFYHIMDHFMLLRRIADLRPRLVIMDSEFISDRNAMIQMTRERTDSVLNAISVARGNDRTVVGIPSTGALERMAEALNFRCEWMDWESLGADERRGVQDYFRPARKRRRSCLLRPV